MEGSMANEEHIGILEQGVDSWNNWRAQHPDVVPDLGEIYLSQVDLTGADFSGVNLYKAQIDHTTLCDADLQNANLKEATIWFTNL
jgi:uncharacterized protein YjbI with pentapeptide repeats